MKKNKFITGIILLIVIIVLLAITIPNHIKEYFDMKECASTPGCMYCLPKWVGPTSYFIYFISFVLLCISILCLIKFKKKTY